MSENARIERLEAALEMIRDGRYRDTVAQGSFCSHGVARPTPCKGCLKEFATRALGDL